MHKNNFETRHECMIFAALLSQEVLHEREPQNEEIFFLIPA